MIDPMRRGLYLLLLAGCTAGPAASPPPEDPVLRELVDAAVRPFLESGKYQGLAVGVLRGDRRCVAGFGRTSARVSTPPDGETIFEIGSVTKAFTATLLLESGLDLHEPIRRHLPAEVKVPTRNGKEITLLHLATHHSGLPRLPGNLAPKDSSNPYADYLVDELYHGLETCELERDPGKSYEYSNLGMGLLGHLLALHAGKSYEELVLEQICRPLGMDDTRVTLTAAQKKRLAPGHLPSGEAAANWDIPVLAGAGALRSTVNDLLRFLQANIGGRYESAHVRKLYIGEGSAIGLAWHLTPLPERSGTIVWHNGGTGGYHSFCGFVPETRTAVVVLGNSTTDTDPIGVSLLTLLQGVK
jgi:CubicO group peptidase (beta-lactamase class C family)